MNNKDVNKVQNKKVSKGYYIFLTIIIFIVSFTVNKFNFKNNFYEFLYFLIPMLLFHVVWNFVIDKIMARMK